MKNIIQSNIIQQKKKEKMKENLKIAIFYYL